MRAESFDPPRAVTLFQAFSITCNPAEIMGSAKFLLGFVGLDPTYAWQFKDNPKNPEGSNV